MGQPLQRKKAKSLQTDAKENPNEEEAESYPPVLALNC